MKEYLFVTRLNKYLSEIGYCSRREADKLIDTGRIKINGETVLMGQKVTNEDLIEIDGALIKNNNTKSVYLAFNKPAGIVCTTDTRVERNNIIDFINFPSRIFPIGRLDKMSEGLIFLTDDGDIVNRILRSRYMHEKEYLVTVNKKIDHDFLKKMSNGIPILGTITKKCDLKYINDYQFKIILTQGLNRQIRRMCDYLGYKVKKLERIRIMNVKLDIPRGKWRLFSNSELKELKKLL